MSRSLIYITFAFLLLSCEKLYHPETISIGKIKDYDELVSAVNGVYARLNNAMGSYNAYDANVKGDDLNTYMQVYDSYYVPLYNISCWQDRTGTFKTDFTWKNLYPVIISINNILNQFIPLSDQNTKNREILGEIYLIRAYCYFRLTRIYGRIPLISNIDINYDLPRSSYTEIYIFIESDLKQAIALLPSDNKSARIPYETPHRGTAKAMLAEVYLSWAGYPAKDVSKYNLAAKESGELIDSASFFGMGLLKDFAWVWDGAHFHNSEAEFTLYFARPDKLPVIDAINQLYGARLYDAYSYHNFKTSPGSPYYLIDFPPAEINFFNNYPTGYRKDLTFFNNIYVPNGKNDEPQYPDIDTGYFHIDTVGLCDRIAYRKFYIQSYIVDDHTLYDYIPAGEVIINFGIQRIYLFRYAQTLLTYAEASARSGQLNAKAYECVNEIRRRARHLDLYTPSPFDLQPGLSSEVFADSVVWERAWELAGEPEGRWFDLVRLEKVEDLSKLRNSAEGGPPYPPITKDSYFFPIPQEDINLNPNLGK